MLRSLLKEYSRVCANRDECAPRAFPQQPTKLIRTKAFSPTRPLQDCGGINPLAVNEDNLVSARGWTDAGCIELENDKEEGARLQEGTHPVLVRRASLHPHGHFGHTPAQFLGVGQLFVVDAGAVSLSRRRCAE